ncbi:sugar ABC transporter ATP-binding protein [Jonesiaceae bacterium BS-20]|uniref:Sugar ABC transporter ATP-binding protein n=1 Tax=Jonesiaceae bacterium BS-20 TaxID=3120821 RepID=A0AAU7DVX3_9MICO
MNSTTPLLEMQDIVKTFPGVRALDGVTITVAKGSIHSICGENGAGKSTLMKVLSGVYPHGDYEGQILLEGKPVEFKNIKQSEEAGVVIIHQELALIPELNVIENIFLGNEVTKNGIIDWDQSARSTKDVLDQVGLKIDPKVKVKTLGVGQQQMIEIAKALSKNVKLLILDEPTSALNEEDSANLLKLMKRLQSQGVTCIMISHKLNEIAAVSDAITILRDGASVESYGIDESGVDEDRIIRAMVGRSLEARYPTRTPHIGETAFEVRNWNVEHPQLAGRMVSKNVNLNVKHGEIVGLAGLMGAGRTELARSVFGRNYGIFRSGEIYLEGKKVTLNTVQSAIDHGIAYLPEDRKVLGVNLLDSVKRTVASANLKALSTRGLLSGTKERKVANSYREQLLIKTPTVETGIRTLSGGNQQKVVLAKWMFTEPQVLILDEPTRGIDVGAKFEIYRLIHQLADAGNAVLLISSELPELMGMSDRIYTICEGEVTGEVLGKDATQESLMRMMTNTQAHEVSTSVPEESNK